MISTNMDFGVVHHNKKQSAKYLTCNKLTTKKKIQCCDNGETPKWAHKHIKMKPCRYT